MPRYTDTLRIAILDKKYLPGEGLDFEPIIREIVYEFF